MRIAKCAVVLSVAAIGVVWATIAVAASVQPGAYSGGTSQDGGSVSFTVADEGGSVEDFKAEMSAVCTKGAASQSVEVTLTPTPSIKIRQSEFSFSGGFVFRNGDAAIGHGKGNVSGNFTSERHVSGTFRFPWEFFANAGLLSGYRCDTGKVTFQGAVGTGAQATAQCIVPKLKRKRLKAAKRAIKQAHCHLSRVVRRHSKAKRQRVIGQRPRAGSQSPAGSAVKLIVSRGPAHH
ncbi:MAG TPA: PASTA domain-containing protein [Solirubrobacterales bacterium]|nr:PASTA domain-containing protein [Solirubrobacterales bacterium]